jgi:hypothetical protein
MADDPGSGAADKRTGAVRCEQCGSREHVLIAACQICARCGAVWPVQTRAGGGHGSDAARDLGQVAARVRASAPTSLP